MNLNREVLKYLIKETMTEELDILKEPTLSEAKGKFKGKFKRVMEILGPTEQAMKGFGVMSGENPMGQKSSSFDNEYSLPAIVPEGNTCAYFIIFEVLSFSKLIFELIISIILTLLSSISSISLFKASSLFSGLAIFIILYTI